MGKKRVSLTWGLLMGAPLLISGAAAGMWQGPPPLGGPLAGLTQQQMQEFNAGRNQFLRNFGPPDGLGPVFNGVSCVQCHAAGAPGGASTNLGVSVVTRIGGMVNGEYSDLAEVGGPVLQARSLRQFIPNYPVPGEIVPPGTQFVSRRITTPLFGAGLIEAIPEANILAQTQVPKPDGIQGVANMVVNPITGNLEVGRFGWKAQISKLNVFSSEAYLNEMGITNPHLPTELPPQGNPIPPGADPVPDPEDEGAAVTEVTEFMRYLAPPAPPISFDRRGQNLFDSINCSACHTPMLRTGPSSNVALAKQMVFLYSDLLLHRMGPALADGIRQGMAEGDQFRTAPLWGLSRRPFYLHDGRAPSIDEAIRLHGGEAAASATRYVNLSQADRQALLTFLGRL